jgi:hypothetical protein
MGIIDHADAMRMVNSSPEKDPFFCAMGLCNEFVK